MTFHMRAGKVVQRRRDEVAAFARPPRNSNAIREKSFTGWTLGSYKLPRVVLFLFTFSRHSFFIRAVFAECLFSFALSFIYFNIVPVRLLGTHQFRGSAMQSSGSVAEYEEAAKIDLHRKIRLRIPFQRIC